VATPSVEIHAPTGAWSKPVEVFWRGRDSDDRRFNDWLEANRDRTSWQVVLPATARTRVRLDPATLPIEGDGWRLRVEGSDGLHVGTAEVGPITLAVQPPMVGIRGVAEADTLRPGRELRVQIDRCVRWNGPE